MLRAGTFARIGVASAIILALVLYFAPIVPENVDCSTFIGLPMQCITSHYVTYYVSPTRALWGRGAYTDDSGYYDPNFPVGNGDALTGSGALLFVVFPAVIVALLILLGGPWNIIAMTRKLFHRLRSFIGHLQ